MDISYIFTQKRKEFGKPCIFVEVGPHSLLNIDANPDLKSEFYLVHSTSRAVDNSKKICAQEVNTVSYPTESQGMSHKEGGWPAGVDITDEDSTARFRKKIEKDKNYSNSIKYLGDIVETYVMENNSIDIYEEYFKGESTKSEEETSFHAINIFKDPNNVRRRIVDLSWSLDSTKIAAAYSTDAIKGSFSEMCIDSYVWDLGNTVAPSCVLKPDMALSNVEFSPTDSNLLLAGYSSGLVALWDTRIGGHAQSLSAVQKSHSLKVSGIKWLGSSNTRMDFISASIDGKVMSWDVRNLTFPINTVLLVPDVIPNLAMEYTVSCLEYDLTVPYKFMVGTEQGHVLSCNLTFESPRDMLGVHYDCKNGPIQTVERNSFFPKLFASCDPWNTKIWSENDSKFPILNLMCGKGYYTDFCWCPTRPSVLFISNSIGVVEVWDISGKHSLPMTTVRLGKVALSNISSSNMGNHIACGDFFGSIRLFEVPNSFNNISEEELKLLSKYIGDDVSEGKPRNERFVGTFKNDEKVFNLDGMRDQLDKEDSPCDKSANGDDDGNICDK